MINNKLNPNWVTGFVDGDGCLYIYIYIYIYLDGRKTCKFGWHIQICFQIKLHIKDNDLLLRIKSFI